MATKMGLRYKRTNKVMSAECFEDVKHCINVKITMKDGKSL